MKSKCSFILKTSVALLLAILMVFGSVSTVIAAVVDVSTGDQSISNAAKKGLDIAGTAANADLASTGGSWIAFKRLYFGVPTSWSGSFTNLYAAARQTNGYCVIIGKLTEQLSGSRIYGTTTGQNIDHSSWGNAEYLYIFASDTSYTVGSGCSNPTVKSSYATTTTTTTTSNNVNITNLNSTSNTYFIYPKSDATGCGIGSEYTNYDNFGYLDATASPHFKQTVSSSTGGSSTISGYRVKNQNTSFEATSATNSYIYPFIGSKVTITATANSGYELDGFYSDSSYRSKITSGVSGNTYTYTVNSTTAKTTYVKYKSTATNYTGITAVAKGTTDGSSYSVDLGSIKSSTTVSSSTGLAVSAPTKSGYTFSKWVASGSGTFDNANNASTTFHPAANSEIATAQYKKIFTIISSVDNTGTGAGTVTTSKTSVEAGGSYTITATAKSGSAVESVKVNDAAKTASASQTISSVSADQTVVVKFAAKPHVIGKVATAGWTEPGDAMTSNAAGTEFTYTRTELAAGTYDFQHYIGTGTGGTYDSTSTDIATKTISGGATLSSVDNGYGGKKFQLVLTAKSDVTLVSNRSKITAITVRRSGGAKDNVTFKKADNTTITGTYLGTPFTTVSADAVVQVYDGDEISFKVTAASGYHISNLTGASSPTFSPVVSDYKITNVTAAKTVTPTAAADVNITAKTNKSSRGTVTVDKNKSFKGDTVKITVTPLAGSLKTLTASYANGDTYEWKSGNTWDEVKAGTSASNALLGAFLSSAKDKFALAPTGAETDEAAIAALPDLAPVGATQTINMEMKEDSAVTINAVFDTYSAESTWYYNGYDTSGNALSGYHGKQMTESMVSGEKFSYYHVEGRSGTDQLMTVSDGVPSSGTRYVYFVRPNNYGDGWSASNNPKAHFWKNGGQDYDTWPGTEMSWQWNNDYGQGVYKIAIPDGADRVSFNDATRNGQHQTVDIDLTTTSGAYYVGEWNSTYSKYDYGTWDTGWADQGWVASGTEYFYQNSTYNGDYTGDFNTKGFNNHNTASKDFAKPKDLDTNSGDYYINVLYPNTTYTINGVTKKTGTNPMIIWSAKSLAGDDENVTIYAKDGSIRSESYGSTYANIADTKIYLNNETVGTKHSGNITNQTYETYKAAKGDTLVIKTQIGATDFSTLSNAASLKAKYYVRGFCVNGEVTELLDWNADGLYTLTYKVPEDDEDLKKIEITPIYYLKDTTANPIVTYRVTGFTDELKAVGTGKPNWGDTLYTYPFYGKLGSNNNALGAYPGQPMVYYKGQYQMQIPQKSTAWDIYYDDSALSGYSGNTAKANAVANTNVSGVTMSNGYYDIVHRSVMGYGDNSASSDHVQTYDYGDFFKIFNEKKPVDNIVFDFKYETKIHNFENQPAATTTKSTLDTNYGTNGNGFELLTNFHGRTVDLFGTPLSGDAADPSKTTPVYVVSIGGVNGSAGVDNIAGYYATEWMVYGSSDGSSYSRISANGKNSIPPEVLVLNDDDTTSFNTTTYPSAVTGKAVTDWKALYTALEAYRGKPVMITYEAADAQIGAGNYATSGGGGATRNDGRWLYSKNGENITSKIKIQYSDDNGATYTDLNTTTPQVDGLSAYFTNDGVEGQMTYSTTIDPDKTFDFEAKTTNGDYKFFGWYMEDGTKITSDNASHTERSGSYTFVAKFMQVQGGQLILSHSADKGTISGTDYQGAGTAKISAVVKDGEEVIRTYDLTTSDITLDDKIIKSDSSYTIDVTLEATATGNDTYGTTTLANPSGQTSTYFSEKSSSIDGKTKTIVLNSFAVASLFSGTTQNVKNIIYHSYFTQAVFNYTLTFNYTDRFNASKSFTRQGTLTSAQAANENYVEKSGNNFSLLPAFIQTVAPHESNFGEDITWNINKASFTQSGSTYTCTATITANQTKETKRNVTFKLPYQHNNGIATVNGDKVGTAATTTDFALTGNNAVAFDTIPVLLNNGVNGIYTEDEKKNWIAAPATLSDNGTTKYFQYWSVKSTSADSENDPEVARCYFQGFNFVALDNYTITPIYDVSPTDITKSGIYTGVSFLETSRNQWNDNQTRQKGETDKASDLLYNDFVLNYNFNGAEIYKNGSDVSDIQELGVVVERVQELGIKQDGSKDTDISHYTSLATDTENVIAAANAEATDGQATYKVGTKPFYKQVVDKTSLDNKNRIMFYDAFYNGAGWNMEKQTSAAKYTYKNYVYRAYTYIKYTDENSQPVVKLADAPAYFTMYDEATATYTAN